MKNAIFLMLLIWLAAFSTKMYASQVILTCDEGQNYSYIFEQTHWEWYPHEEGEPTLAFATTVMKMGDVTVVGTLHSDHMPKNKNPLFQFDSAWIGSGPTLHCLYKINNPEIQGNWSGGRFFDGSSHLLAVKNCKIQPNGKVIVCDSLT